MAKAKYDVYENEGFIAVAPAATKNKSERDRYMRVQYEKFKRLQAEERKEKTFSE